MIAAIQHMLEAIVQYVLEVQEYVLIQQILHNYAQEGLLGAIIMV